MNTLQAMSLYSLIELSFPDYQEIIRHAFFSFPDFDRISYLETWDIREIFFLPNPLLLLLLLLMANHWEFCLCLLMK